MTDWQGHLTIGQRKFQQTDLTRDPFLNMHHVQVEDLVDFLL